MPSESGKHSASHSVSGSGTIDRGPHPEPESSPRRFCPVRYLTWGGTIAMIAATVSLVVAIRGRTPPAPTELPRKLANVEIITVTPREYRETLILPARVEAGEMVEISSELPGRLSRWLIDDGAVVEAGDVVAELDTQALNAQLAQMQAGKSAVEKQVAVARCHLDVATVALEKAVKDAASLNITVSAAESERALAQKTHDRAKKLIESDVSTQAELDASQNNLTQARLRVEEASDAIDRALVGVAAAKAQIAESKAAMELAETRVIESERGIDAIRVNVEKSSLCSPLDGRFEKRLAEAGEVISPRQTLGCVYDLRHVKVVVDVADRYVPFLDASNPTVGTFVSLSMPGARQDIRARLVLPGLPKLTAGEVPGLEFQAEITRIAQASDPLSNTFEVELHLPNPAGALKEGIIAEARIDYLHYPEAIVIPLRSIQVSDVGPRVLVVGKRDGQDVAFVRDVELLSTRGGQVLLGSGVEPGDRLVVAGGKGVLNGETVRIIMANGVILTGDHGPGGATDQTHADPQTADVPAPTREEHR